MAAEGDSNPKLGYWAIRGLGQPCRLLLAYSGKAFDEKLYTLKQVDGKWDRSEWLDEKFSLGLDFPNLPYLIHGSLKLTQSTAIIMYLAELAGLLGSTPEIRARANMLSCFASDIRAPYVSLSYNPQFTILKEEFVEGTLTLALEELQSFIARHGGPYLLGAELTFADLIWYDLLEQFAVLAPGIVKSYPRLVTFCATIDALPQIAAYKQSPGFIDRPFNNLSASFK